MFGRRDGGGRDERIGCIVLIPRVWYVRKKINDKKFKCNYKFVSCLLKVLPSIFFSILKKN